jgi:uncharacterized membrane protein YkvA (DUF1232 family)
MSPSRLDQMARERLEDRAAGRPERGLFTGRGSQAKADGPKTDRAKADGEDAPQSARQRERARLRERVERSRRLHDEMAATDGAETDELDLEGPEIDAFEDASDDDLDDPVVRGRPRTGAKRSVLRAIRQIPAYIRLMLGLMSDARVSKIDRFMVVAAIGYVISPFDFVPDFLPFLGQVDDIFLVTTALQRLVDRAGRRVVLDHWSGDPHEVSDVNLTSIVSAAAFFLPGGIRRRLRGMARGKRRGR